MAVETVVTLCFGAFAGRGAPGFAGCAYPARAATRCQSLTITMGLDRVE